MNSPTLSRLRRRAISCPAGRLPRLTAFFACAALCLGADARASDNWPQFRGPGLNPAVADRPNLPDRWSQTENVEWVAEIPGLGWSSPGVWGNRVFLTSAVADGDFERPQAGLYAPRGRSEPPQAIHDWRVYCLDLSSPTARSASAPTTSTASCCGRWTAACPGPTKWRWRHRQSSATGC